VDDYELRKYSKNWRRPKVFEDLEKLEDINNDNNRSLPNVAETHTGYIVDKENKIIEYPRPIGAQIEALYELKKNRLDGADKGLVVAATGERVIIVTGCSFYCIIKDFTNFKEIYFIHCLES
jgi:superfamily II DNA or RNA helicase